jgi:hypothetical protein
VVAVVVGRSETEAHTDGVDTRTIHTWVSLKTDIGRLDDRVYALAAGLRPAVERAQSAATSKQ